MKKDVMVYWKAPEVKEFVDNEHSLVGLVGKQLQRLSPGDTIWIVTVANGELILAGPIPIDNINKDNNGVYWAGVEDSNTYNARWIPLGKFQKKIRFISTKGNDKLTITDGKVNPMQLQTNRVLTPKSAELFRRIWDKTEHSNKPDQENGALIPEEVLDSKTYPEGAVFRIHVNAYERSAAARSACLSHYGKVCVVCEINLQTVYGNVAAGLIHVHHIKPLASVGKSYRVDPISDLRPVCPNCHAVIHLYEPPLSIEQIKVYIQQAKKGP